MKTLEELKQFYDTALREDIKVLEEKRKAIVTKLTIAAAVLGVIGLIVLAVLSQQIGAFMPAVIFPLIICIMIFAGAIWIFTRSYVMEFKLTVIQRIVNFIDENLRYSAKGHISRSTFVASQIFKTRPNRYKGDDYVSGKIGDTRTEFSELHAEYESGSGKNRSRHTVFKGLFFVADFNKHFTCRVVVLPDTAEKLFGAFGKLLQSWNIARDDIVKLEDLEFEQNFVVYANDQVQARYILSTSLMERIVDFKRKTGRPIYLSFVGSNVYVAISYTRNLFEPRLFRTILDFELVQEYFEDLQLAVGIVDDLNLNTRIWTKQ